MPKIVSRLNDDQARISELQDILTAATDGIMSTDTSATIPLATDMDGLIAQTDQVMATMVETMEVMSFRYSQVTAELLLMAMQLDVAQDALANLVGNIDYDEAMDHATMDLMDGFCASGAADISPDGEMMFDQRISFSKEDIKPILREAIVRWVEQKMAQ